MKKQILITTSLLLSSAMSFGAGYQINLQGLRQVAMGGTGTAIAWDAATMFYNPAGLSELEGIQAYAGMYFIMPNTTYVQSPGVYVAKTQQQTFTPINVYVGGPVAYKSDLSVGLAIYTPFGLGIKWDDNWVGRYMVQEAELKTVFFQPTVSYKINDKVSVGGGPVYARGSVELRRAIPVQGLDFNDGTAHLSGNGHGFGFNVGVHFNASEDLQFGFNYRSRVNMKTNDGSAQFTVPASLASSFAPTTFDANLPLPQVATVGVGYKVNNSLTLQGDISFTGWSAYEELAFDYEQNSASLADSREPRDYRNTVSIRVGGNYVASDRVSLMFGAGYDPSPVRSGLVSPELPESDHGLITGGITYKPFERFTIMGAIEYASTGKHNASYDPGGFKGRYQSNAIVPGIGVSYDF